MAATDNVVQLFAKLPVPGLCKSRLAAECGPEAAAVLARAMLSCTLAKVAPAPPGRRVEWHFWPPDALGRAESLAPPRVRLCPQVEGDLGERLYLGCRAAFDAGARHVVLIGADSPLFRPSELDRAFSELSRVPVVLGPAEDGGFWLLGLNRPERRLFEAIPWGTPAVLGTLMDHFGELGLPVARIEAAHDVDRLEDVDWLAAELARTGEEPLLLEACRQVQAARPRGAEAGT